MPEVVYAASFRRDAAEVWDFIGQESPDRADAVLDAVDDTIALLLQYPETGRSRDELRPGIRSLVTARRYVLYYRPLEDARIVVLRLLHSARDLEGLF